MPENTAQPYDPSAYPPVAVTVDLVLMSVVDGQLAVLLQRRSADPFAGKQALPGSFVRPEEGLDDAARRVLADKGGFADETDVWLEQLYSFGDPRRDPRMRIVSVAYFALLSPQRMAQALATRDDLALVPLTDLEAPLAFDHAAIIALTHERLKGKLDYIPLAFSLLPALFTLRDLQAVHEAILGTHLNKPAFRRRLLDTGWIEPTGEREADTAFRPAELYRRRA
ncbi:NUDIX hydrolase [Novosphingobium terrae]|uniref:NUDIX hydrolase n=1 Tax=Novosphingobium terrae TaxID=2726189 RepID=UPI001981AF7C|nr:NUDIX domain-containing protein [Novosphingobium terrae]